ncbi:MAG TPA: hypothetical protein VHM24_13405 [Gemmatimonadaceae bacterium]|nr:hypothetical protein [Gemmatimonadaceae bacterium]
MRTKTALVLFALIIAGCNRDSARASDKPAAGVDTTVKTGAAVIDPATATGQSAAGAANSSPGTGGMVDPNTAGAADLTAAGVPADVAAKVVASRPYTSMLAVDKILAQKLDEKQRDSVYTRVWIPIDLNSATADEIMLIPGVGRRMRHEFEEYRPYTAIEQFRREIGKYVDKAEVARLEKYVTIK